MIVINKRTGIDVTRYILQMMKGTITKAEFEDLAGVSAIHTED
jgi:hypothetical protein